MPIAAPTDSKLNRDIIVNFAGRFATLGATYLFIPFYVRILGLDNYALIALYFVILTFAALADAGLSATLAREAARTSDRQEFFSKLVTAERILITAFAAMGLLLALAAPWIARGWLDIADPVLRAHAIDALRLMGVSMVFQQVLGLYTGALMGLQRQPLANGIQVAYIFVRAGLIIPLIEWTPDIRLFFWWQLGANLAFMLIARTALLRIIGQRAWAVGIADFALLRPSLGFAGGMMAMSVVAAVNSQMDRVVTSALLPLRDFSSFSLAASAAQLPYIVLTPFAAAMLPRLTAAFEESDGQAALRVFLPVAYAATALAALASATLVFFAPELMALWLGNTVVSPAMLTTVQIMAIGSLALAAATLPYHVAIANGHTRTSLLLNVSVLPLSLLILILATPAYGIVGAAFPWLLSSCVSLVGLSLIIHRRYLPNLSGRQFVIFALLPVAISFMAMAGARAAADQIANTNLAAIGLAVAGGLAGLLLVWLARFLISDSLREGSANVD